MTNNKGFERIHKKNNKGYSYKNYEKIDSCIRKQAKKAKAKRNNR